jgi:hypothetical protein
MGCRTPSADCLIIHKQSKYGERLGRHEDGSTAILAGTMRNVRFWHKADMLNALTDVRFWG